MNKIAETRVALYKLKKMVMKTNLPTVAIQKIIYNIDQVDDDLMIILKELLKYNYKRVELLDTDEYCD